jgi:hypothetical protein
VTRPHPVGAKTLNFTAFDLAGLAASQECTQTVIYEFGRVANYRKKTAHLERFFAGFTSTSVPTWGFEPPTRLIEQILNLQRLPLHHVGLIRKPWW